MLCLSISVLQLSFKPDSRDEKHTSKKNYALNDYSIAFHFISDFILFSFCLSDAMRYDISVRCLNGWLATHTHNGHEFRTNCLFLFICARRTAYERRIQNNAIRNFNFQLYSSLKNCSAIQTK